jgi:hypothetical protein
MTKEERKKLIINKPEKNKNKTSYIYKTTKESKIKANLTS